MYIIVLYSISKLIVFTRLLRAYPSCAANIFKHSLSNLFHDNRKQPEQPDQPDPWKSELKIPIHSFVNQVHDLCFTVLLVPKLRPQNTAFTKYNQCNFYGYVLKFLKLHSLPSLHDATLPHLVSYPSVVDNYASGRIVAKCLPEL